MAVLTNYNLYLFVFELLSFPVRYTITTDKWTASYKIIKKQNAS